MSQIWISIQPETVETKIMITRGEQGCVMRARLPSAPENPEALPMFLRAIAIWYGEPVHAVLDAGSVEVYNHPEKWARLIGDVDDALIQVQWSGYEKWPPGDKLSGTVGDFRSARRLLTFAGVGIK